MVKILHLNGFSDTELKHYSFLVHTNVITAMQQLIVGLEILAIDSSRDNIAEEMETIRRFVESTKYTTSSIDTETARTVSVLWSSSSIQTCYERRAEIDLLESAKYFLDDVDRVTNQSYVPTPQDINKEYTIGTLPDL
uniref:Uncharacterized protein n=1 Tax=Romanomermis culicivorax TaxID=13658 RepID=A0A915HHD9_ROMCU